VTDLVRDLTEEQLLAKIFPLLPKGKATIVGPGDDAAVVAAPDGQYVVSTDVLVQDRHFRTRWSSGYDVGRRAAAQNLADIAAMGARPTSLVVCLVVPDTTTVEWVTDMARGLADACAPVRAGVVGGDLSGGDTITVAVTVHGTLDWRPPVLRSGARPGDVLAHAGVRGRSAAGHALLDAGLVTPSGERHAELVAAYLRPEPPLAAGPAAARGGATAMLDLSDGLLRDAGRLARASHVHLDLDPSAFAADRKVLLPAAEEVSAATGVPAAELLARWVYGGGEDHGLLATFPGADLPSGWDAVGRVLEVGADGPEVTVGGQEPGVGPGWDHFAR